MPDKNCVVACLVVDRSGSVQSFLSDAQGMVDQYLEGRRKQAAKGLRVLVRLVQFDTVYEEIFPLTPAADVPGYTLVPRGSTALLDAMGVAMVELGEQLAAMPEKQRPGKVLFGVLTDGKENASQEWTYERVSELVTQQERDYGWDVSYLGAVDALEEAKKLGVRREAALQFSTTKGGTTNTAESYDSYIVATASAAPGVRSAFSDEDRKRATSS